MAFEFLAEADWRRQQGKNFLDQDYFARYVADNWVAKAEYLQDGFADVRYFEASERGRLRVKIGKKLSFNAGIVQRISSPTDTTLFRNGCLTTIRYTTPLWLLNRGILST